MSFKLKDANNIAIGPAEILIGDSASNLEFINPVLNQDNYFGYAEVTNIVYSTQYNSRTYVNTNYDAEDYKADRTSCTIEMQTVELSKDILKLLIGIDPASNGNIIPIHKIADVDFRLEITYNYPNKTRKLQLVFPKIRIRSGLNLSLTGDAEVSQSLYMYALPVYTEPWENYNLGIVYLDGFGD